MRSPSTTRSSAATGAVVVIALICLGLAQTGVGGRVLRTVGVAAPSQPYTELAFADPVNPGTPEPNGQVRVRFWVRNVEGIERTYPWTATTQAPGRAPQTAATGLITLANGGSVTVTTLVPARCASSRSRINVSLNGGQQAIGYWQSCPVSK